VKRAHAKAAPILGDLLGSLEGDEREQYAASIDDVTALISSGKFSQAFQYPQLIESGVALYERQKKQQEEAARARRAMENAKRTVSDTLRDAGPRLSPEATSRLNRALRAASDQESIDAVAAEAREAMVSARAIEEKRRDREISRTKSRIQRSLPKNTNGADGTETWQDVLRRLQEQMSAEETEPAEEVPVSS